MNEQSRFVALSGHVSIRPFFFFIPVSRKGEEENIEKEKEIGEESKEKKTSLQSFIKRQSRLGNTIDNKIILQLDKRMITHIHPLI